jgi:hypothetical protein
MAATRACARSLRKTTRITNGSRPSSAGASFFAARDMVNLRNPDNFSMHTYSDHVGWGVVEVTQNMLLDVAEADGDWRAQWAACEALGFFLRTDMIEPMLM